MKQSKYSDAQIMGILKQAEGGVPVCLTSAPMEQIYVIE